ncbi:MAG: tripartite tricarboxylate transporter TctB family protein [Candidatus Puniceispirillaceae bacterium]|jgi:putative tricarboxylic transport membrane protein
MIRNQAVPIVLTALSIIIIYLALQLDLSPPMIVGDSMQPRSFPIFLMILNLILTVTLAYQIHKNPPKQPEKMNPTTWLSMILMVLFYGLTISTDMFIAIAVVMFLLSLAWGERRLLVAFANAILTPFFIFLLFDNVLRIRFPRGIIMNWYYG